ncbi:MAG: sulfoxide reductase heme-binding subunit YedZ [Proteobacteria bacterium]|nr:sulfoxide reductase heme-binding subunit YedZ [Pseudomonadota bacterium]
MPPRLHCFISRLGKPLVFATSLLPLVWLAWLAWRDQLGANPVETLSHRTGDWSLRFLLLTLAVTPLRRLTGWNGLQRFRRLLGLFAFFYVSLIPLAVTSTGGMMKRLGRNWQGLHRLVYLIGALGVLHYLWLVKADLSEPLLYAGILALLLSYRLWWWRTHSATATRSTR